MKTERRHELEANTLARHLEKILERLRPYSSAILAVISAGLILAAAYSYLSQRNQAGTAEAWYVYHQAANAVQPDIKQLQLIIAEYPHEPVANFARLVIAEASLGQGIESLFNDRAAAEEELAEAEKYFKEILSHARDVYLLEQAHLGLARVYESRNELDKAREQYSLIGEGSALHQYAQNRLNNLNDPHVRDFYDWFAEQNPSPPKGATGMPLDMTLPDHPLPGAGEGGPFLFPDVKPSDAEGGASSPSPPTDSPSPSDSTPASGAEEDGSRRPHSSSTSGASASHQGDSGDSTPEKDLSPVPPEEAGQSP